MVFDKLVGFLLGKQRPVGLAIELGTTNSVLTRTGCRIRGSGAYMRMQEGGYRWKKAKNRAALFPAIETNPHILVSGMSGFGKSMLFKSMMIDAAGSGHSCIVFDGHNEHRDVVRMLGGRTYDSRDGGINLLSLDGATVSDRTAALLSLFSGVYRLGHIQSTKLGQCLWYTYRRFGARSSGDRALHREPKVGDLLFEIGIFIKNAKTASERATLMHLQSKISNLNTPAFNSDVGGGGWPGSGIHSFSVSERMSKEARMIYLVELLERVYARMKEGQKTGGIRQYIMIDESQVLINESEECSGIITKFIEEGRKYGRGVIIVTHMSSRLNRQIVANSATFVAFYSREPSEAAYVAKVMSSNFDAEQAVRAKLAALKEGEAMVVSARERVPKVVSTMGLRSRIGSCKAEARPFDLGIADRPVTMSELCRKMGMTEQEVEVKVKDGVLEKASVLGVDWVMKRSNPGVEHEVMVERIRKLLDEAGIMSYVHNRANGPDVVAYGKEGKTAIEYETGSKRLEESLEMLKRREKEYAKVILVVNDAHAARYREACKGTGIVAVEASRLDGMVATLLSCS